jgi:hypothetical protein
MEPECKEKLMRLQVANVYIRLCGVEVEVGISPPWDTTGRHEYVFIDKIDRAVEGLKQLSKEILFVADELEKMVKEVGELPVRVEIN